MILKPVARLSAIAISLAAGFMSRTPMALRAAEVKSLTVPLPFGLVRYTSYLVPASFVYAIGGAARAGTEIAAAEVAANATKVRRLKTMRYPRQKESHGCRLARARRVTQPTPRPPRRM